MSNEQSPNYLETTQQYLYPLDSVGYSTLDHPNLPQVPGRPVDTLWDADAQQMYLPVTSSDVAQRSSYLFELLYHEAWLRVRERTYIVSERYIAFLATVVSFGCVLLLGGVGAAVICGVVYGAGALYLYLAQSGYGGYPDTYSYHQGYGYLPVSIAYIFIITFALAFGIWKLGPPKRD